MSTLAANPSAPVVSEDLSEQIRLTVSREPGDVVRCTRVNDRHYRCNWWQSLFQQSGFDNPGMKGGQLGTTYRVRKSSFLEVTRNGTELRITEIAQKPKRSNFV